MSIPEILHQLARVPGRADFAPYATALEAAVEQRAAITPELIAIIERVIADPAHYLNNHDECSHHFAIYLLAQFREPRARDAFLRFFSLPEETALELTGDMVTENGGAILASVCGGDPAPLLHLILAESVNEFVRQQAMAALAVQHLWGERPREAVIADLRRVFQQLPRPGHDYVWASFASLVCDFQATELVAEVRQIFAAGLADETIIGAADFEREMAAPNSTALDFLREHNAPIDASFECSSWTCFRDEEPLSPLERLGLVPEFHAKFATPHHEPFEPGEILATSEAPYLAPAKVGRNDPCPCGSGKKHKKCCGKN